MEIKYKLTGNERKALVSAIGKALDATPKYKGAPTFSYEIDVFTVDKNGSLLFNDRTDSEVVENLLEYLGNQGFNYEPPNDRLDQDSLVIEIPKVQFTEASLSNLEKLVKSKETLIKKALGANDLTIKQSDYKICFPWFSYLPGPDEIKAYAHFITALSEMARTQQRVTTACKKVDNEKYAFRCFLLRLGFIGARYKSERKVLLSKLTGSSAFRNGARSSEEVPE